MFGDVLKGSMTENGTYCAASVVWFFVKKCVAFCGEGGIGMVNGGTGDRLCVEVKMRKQIFVFMSTFG